MYDLHNYHCINIHSQKENNTINKKWNKKNLKLAQMIIYTIFS